MSEKASAQRYLAVHEWAAIFTIIGFVLLVAIVCWINNADDEQNSASPGPHHIEVSISGAVKRPGIYQLAAGAHLAELLALAEVDEQADMRRFSAKRVLRHNQSIHIRTKPMITIYLSGAVVNAGEVRVPQGTRLSDLKQQGLLLPQADAKVVANKRYLRDQQKIYIPAAQ